MHGVTMKIFSIICCGKWHCEAVQR